MPKIVLATAVLTDVMATSPIKLHTAAMIIAGVGRIARVPTTVAIALGASVAPFTTVAPKHNTMMSNNTGFATIAPKMVAIETDICAPFVSHVFRHCVFDENNKKRVSNHCKCSVKSLQIFSKQGCDYAFGFAQASKAVKLLCFCMSTHAPKAIELLCFCMSTHAPKLGNTSIYSKTTSS